MGVNMWIPLIPYGGSILVPKEKHKSPAGHWKGFEASVKKIIVWLGWLSLAFSNARMILLR